MLSGTETMDEIQAHPPRPQRNEEPEREHSAEFILGSTVDSTGSIVGLVSLFLCIAGLILPVLLCVFLNNITTVPKPSDPVPLCGFLFLVLELSAFVCGILALRTNAGKAGVLVSTLFLSPIIAWVVFWAYIKLTKFIDHL
jgi:hypothetical protein